MTKPDWYNEWLDHEESRANDWLCEQDLNINKKGNEMRKAERQESRLSYFTEDGNYGSGMFVLLNTANWTNADWYRIEMAPDSDRLRIALLIDENKEKNK